MMSVNKDSDYYKRIRKRSCLHFVVGLIPRICLFCKYAHTRRIAKRKGAQIGEDTIILKSLAKRANRNLCIGSNTLIVFTTDYYSIFYR